MSVTRPLEKTGGTATERLPGSRTYGLRAVAYATGLLFLLVSLLDIATVAWPVQLDAVAWRFGTVGAASNYILTLFVGFALLSWSAAWFGDRILLRVLSLFSLLAALLLLGLMGDFILSSVQLAGSVPSLERATFRIGVMKATTKYAAFALAFLVTAASAWRASHPARRRA